MTPPSTSSATSSAPFADFSDRAAAVTLRTYCRQLDPEDASRGFESWPQVIRRSTYEHHLRLWEEAGGKPVKKELEELSQLGMQRRSLVAGRTLFLGGTPYAFERACCQENCAAGPAETVYDIVDIAWLLLNGSGVGFEPKVGVLHGYVGGVPELEVIPSAKGSYDRGEPNNEETRPCDSNGWTWTIKVGDSAEAWAKAHGKLLSGYAYRAKKLVLDTSNCRGPGGRLRGYGWICNGPAPLAKCLSGIHAIMARKADNLLDEIDIGDSVNMIGEVLSSRRSAQIWHLPSHSPLINEFARAKFEYWETAPWRRQSNNSAVFWSKPSLKKILELLYAADECGGDPAIINGEAAVRKMPWWQRFNPCGEIGLGAFCSLVTNCLPRFRKDFSALERAVYLISRANYRQTCVDFRDGVLQPRWHQLNQALHLCGVSLTGIVQADWMTDYQVRRLRNAATLGAYAMADELGQPRPKAITTIKPEGTGSKCMGSPDVGEIAEGVHKPLGRFIHNWINVSVHDPLLQLHKQAGYRTTPNPQDRNNELICFPVEYRGIKFDQVEGKDVNLEPAVAQLDRYLRWNNLWADHHVSSTVSYSPNELPEVARWIDAHWDDGYICATLLRRNDPTKTARDLGHPYLPQEVVTREEFENYRRSLRPVNLSKLAGGVYDLTVEDCPRGVCPVR